MALRQEGYWDEHYEQELKNYLEDGDEGEIWFGKALNRKIVDWVLRRTSSPETKQQAIQVIDVGCGNAFLLCTLIEKSEETRVEALGIDYSTNSISLSTKIVKDRSLQQQIQLRECDFLDHAQVSSISEKRFDYIIDKGTYDAICLLHNEPQDKLSKARETYLRSVGMLAKTGSIFILASCNHTEEELRLLFSSSEEFSRHSKVIDKIETPSIKFGGKSGSQVTCLIIELNLPSP